MPDIPPNPEIPGDLSKVLAELITGGYEIVDSKVEGGVLQSLEVRPLEGEENITYLYEREGDYNKDTGLSYSTIMHIYDDGYAEQVRVCVDGAWLTV